MEKKVVRDICLYPIMFIAVFLVYLFAEALLDRYKYYYFPQIDTHLTVYNPPFDDYGYLVLSKNGLVDFSDSVDFVRVHKSELKEVDLIFDPSESDRVYIVDKTGDATFNGVDFTFKKIDRMDTTFFEIDVFMGKELPMLKLKYFDVFAENYLRSVCFVDGESIEVASKIEKRE